MLALRQFRQLAARKPNYIRLYSAEPNPLKNAFNFSDDDDDHGTYKPKNPKKPNCALVPMKWESMKKVDQDAVLAYLEDRMRGDWKEMTLDEKKAAWFVYYGPWGARAPDVEQVTGKGMGTFIKVGLALTIGLTAYMVSKDIMAADEDEVVAA